MKSVVEKLFLLSVTVLTVTSCLSIESNKMVAVDLGLSVKWATCNIGASDPEEIGGCFMWAGTEEVSGDDMNLDTPCPYLVEVPDMDRFWAKYNSTDYKTVLDPEDDVAHITLRRKWRMPTKEEWEEMLNNCTMSYEAMNDVYGYRFTSNVPGYTDKSIFLPPLLANGLNLGSSYWSSSLDSNDPGRAYCLSIFNYWYIDRCPRNCGCPIRPVTD